MATCNCRGGLICCMRRYYAPFFTMEIPDYRILPYHNEWSRWTWTSNKSEPLMTRRDKVTAIRHDEA